MKTYNEIFNEIQTTKAKITHEKKNKVEQLISLYRNGDKNLIEKIHKADTEAEEEKARNTDLQIKIQLLINNAKIAYFKENIHKICEIWNKYEGKPLGEKTTEKIRIELKSATGQHIRISNHYDDAKIYVVFDYREPRICDSMEFIPIWNGKKQPAVDQNNKAVRLEAENFRVYLGSDYVENVEEHLEKLKTAHKIALEKQEEYEQAIREYNALTMGNIQTASAREGVKNWLI